MRIPSTPRAAGLMLGVTAFLAVNTPASGFCNIADALGFGNRATGGGDGPAAKKTGKTIFDFTVRASKVASALHQVGATATSSKPNARHSRSAGQGRRGQAGAAGHVPRDGQGGARRQCRPTVRTDGPEREGARLVWFTGGARWSMGHGTGRRTDRLTD